MGHERNERRRQQKLANELRRASLQINRQELKRTSEGHYEIILREPIDFANLATICMMPGHLAHLKAEAHLFEQGSEHTIIGCIKVEVTDRASGSHVDCQDFDIIVGPTQVFTRILNA